MMTKHFYEDCESTEINKMFSTSEKNEESKVSVLRELFKPSSKIPSPITSKIVNILIAISGLKKIR